MIALPLVELDDAPVEREAYRLNTLSEATWAMQKIAYHKSKKAEVKSVADEHIARYQAWVSQENRKHDDDISYFEGLLRDYAIRQREANPKFKGESTPYGKVGFRKQSPEWLYDDMKLLESLKSAGRDDLIRIKEEPNKAELKKIVAVQDGRVIDPESGAIIEGVTVLMREDAVVLEVSP